MARLKPAERRKLRQLQEIFGEMGSLQALDKACKAEKLARDMDASFKKNPRVDCYEEAAKDWRKEQNLLELYALLLEKQERGNCHA